MRFIRSVLKPQTNQIIKTDWVFDLAKSVSHFEAEVIGVIQMSPIFKEEERIQYIGAVCGMWLAQREGMRVEDAPPSRISVEAAFDPSLRKVVEMSSREIHQIVPHVGFVGAAWSYSYVIITR